MDSHPEGSPGRDKKTPAASKSEKLTLAAGVVTLSTAVIKLVVGKAFKQSSKVAAFGGCFRSVLG